MGTGVSQHGKSNTSSPCLSLSIDSGIETTKESSSLQLANVLTSKMTQPGPRPSSRGNAYRYIRSFSKNKALQEDLKEAKHSELTTHVFGLFNQVKQFLANENNKTDKMFGEFNRLLEDNILLQFRNFDGEEQREVMGNKLAQIQFVKLAVDYYIYILEDEGIQAVTTALVVESQKNQNPGDNLVLKLREVFWNFSDGSHNYGEKLAETELFSYLMKDLEAMIDDGLEQLEHNEDSFAFNSAVGILHNCARNHDIDCDIFRDIGAIEMLSPFLESTDVYVKMVTLLALGNMINFDDKTQVCLLDTGRDVVTFVFQAIQDALVAEDRRAHGFSVSELVDGLTSLAKSEDNKREIMALPPLGAIKKILQRKEKRPESYSQYNGEVLSEKLAVIRLVWELVFLEQNKDIIRADAELLKLLSELKRHNDSEMRTAATGACFIIVEMVKEKFRISSKVARPDAVQLRSAAKGTPHIMISYQWTDQATVLKINDYLESKNYNTWLDVKFMKDYGSVLDGMASAVEGAWMVLICYSEKYKLSQNCRTEAEFAFVCQKPYIGIKMQQDYRADGWLGAILGAKLYIEFSGKYPFDDKCAELRDRLGTMEPNQRADQSITPKEPLPVLTPPVDIKVKKLETWMSHDVEHWASEHRMERGRPYTRVRQLTGQQLKFLFKVYTQAPDTFYRWLETKLRLDGLEEIMRFTNAIEGLGKFV